MVEASEEDFRSEMDNQAQEQRDAINAMNQFDNRLKGSRVFGGGDSSSDEEDNQQRQPKSQLDIEKQKNQILMDKLFRS